MAEQEKTQTREREPLPGSLYEKSIREIAEFHERQQSGRIHVKKADIVAQMNRQNNTEFLLHVDSFPTALHNWRVFVATIRNQSGKHRHQGGLVLFVLEGSGWTVCNGVRYDWSQGDLILLPLQEGGVEHQHFSADPDVPTKWVAFIHEPTLIESASELVQLEVMLEYQKKHASQFK